VGIDACIFVYGVYGRGGFHAYTYLDMRIDVYTHYTYIHVTSHSDMGWLQSGGFLKLQISFAKEPYKRDDILQKRPVNLRRLFIVTTP